MIQLNPLVGIAESFVGYESREKHQKKQSTNMETDSADQLESCKLLHI